MADNYTKNDEIFKRNDYGEKDNIGKNAFEGEVLDEQKACKRKKRKQKDNKPKRRELVYFRRINKLASVAVYLTTILLIYLFLSSFISGAVSGSDTAKVMGMLVTIFGKDDDVAAGTNTNDTVIGGEPERITVALEKGEFKYHYNGDACKLEVKFYPDGANTYPLKFTSSDSSVATVSDDGTVSFLQKGTAKIEVETDCETKLKCEVTVKSYGQNPIYGNAAVELTNSEPKVGGKSGFSINGGDTLSGAAEFSSLDESRVEVINGTAYFIKEGEASLRATFENGTTSDFKVYVKPNADMVKFSDITLKGGKFLSGETFAATDLVESYAPNNAEFNFKITSDNPSVVAVEKGNLVMKDKGTANVTFSPFFDRDFKKTVQIEVWKETPTSLKIVSENQVTVNATIKLVTESQPVDYPDDVEWTVVSGFGKIVDGNKLKAEFFGKIKVRCQSTLNPELTDETVVDVILYSDFYSFVRKILGHFSLFALLGLGIWGSAFLLTNPTYSVVISVGVSFICAALCEMFQACTPGRYFAISDVFVNFSGTLTGMTIGIFAVFLYCIIKRIISKESYKKVKEAYSWVTVYTVFCKRKKSKPTKENNQ